jgi:hypothetical protein
LAAAGFAGLPGGGDEDWSFLCTGCLRPDSTVKALVATLPRHLGETLVQAPGLGVLVCPLPIPPFTVKQYWCAR